VSSATGRIRRGERVGDRVPAIADFYVRSARLQDGEQPKVRALHGESSTGLALAPETCALPNRSLLTNHVSPGIRVWDAELGVLLGPVQAGASE
jgi:hypothetical protein